MRSRAGLLRGTSRSLLERAGLSSSERGADVLFARLGALRSRQEAADLLEQLAGRIREGEWSAGIAALISAAEQLEKPPRR